MNQIRSQTYLLAQLDKQATRFVNETLTYSNNLSTGSPNRNSIAALKSILVDWENTALIVENTNYTLENLVLDRIITE